MQAKQSKLLLAETSLSSEKSFILIQMGIDKNTSRLLLNIFSWIIFDITQITVHIENIINHFVFAPIPS